MLLNSCTNDPLLTEAQIPPAPPLRMWATEAGEDSVVLEWADINESVTEFAIMQAYGQSAFTLQPAYTEIARVPATTRTYGMMFTPDPNGNGAQFSVKSIRDQNVSKVSQIAHVYIGQEIVLNKDNDITFTSQPNNSAAYSPNGSLVAIAGNDGTVKIWNLTSYSFGDLPIRTITVGSVSVGVAKFSPDNQMIVTGSSDGLVKIWNVADGSLLATLTGHTSGVYSLDYSRDGKYIVSGSFDGTAKVWDAVTRTELLTTSKTLASVTSVAINPDSKSFVLGNSDGKIRSFNIVTGSEGTPLTHGSGWVYCLAYSPDGSLLASGGSDNIAKIWNVAGNSAVNTLSGHTGWIMGLSFSNTGRSVFTVSKDKSVKMWKTADGSLSKSVTTNAEQAGIAVNPFGGKFITATAGTIQYWRYSTLRVSGFF